MTTPNATTEKEFNPFDTTATPPERTYDFFGKVEMSFWDCGFIKAVYENGVKVKQGAKEAYDPTRHDKRFTAVDIYIQPLAEMDVKYPFLLEIHEIGEFDSWTKIVNPSLRDLGIKDSREINNRWARVTRVPNGKKYPKKSGGEGDETTFRFVELFADEDACRAAYLAAGGRPADANGNGANGNGHNVPAAIPNEDTERATAYQFLKVIVGNAAKGKETFAEAQEAVGLALAQYPTVAKFYLANSVETGELITQVTGKLPF